MGHDLENFISPVIRQRIEDLTSGSIPYVCTCDDFEVDGSVVVRRCAWNDYQQLEAELYKREMAVNR